MSFIFTNIIKPGSKVEKTIFHVFNWEGVKSNVEEISLIFDNQEEISYATELYLDLSDGSYIYDDGNYTLIEEEDIHQVTITKGEVDTDDTTIYNNEINMLKNHIDYILNLNVFEEITIELNNILNKLNKDNFTTSKNRCDEIAKELNYKIYNLFNDYSNDALEVKQRKKYISYLFDALTNIIDTKFTNKFRKELLNLCKNLTVENMYETDKIANKICEKINNKKCLE